MLCQTTYTISGNLADSTGKPVDFASISVLSFNDNKVIYQGLSSDSTGRYRISLGKPGHFLLKFQKVGYQTFSSGEIILGGTQKDALLQKIIMPLAIARLNEVVISSSRPLVEQKLDKIVLNVAGNVLSPSDNALDVFRMGPGVTVDSHSQIKLNGKSVTVLVDGRTVPGGPQATSNYLNSLPANAIREVELISNPTSQYDAGGGAAVINIIPKKVTQDGLRGNIYSGYDYSKFNSANLFSSLSIKKGKTLVSASLGTNTEASNQTGRQSQFFFADGATIQNSSTEFKRKYGLFSNVSINYDISPGTYIGAGLGYNFLKVNGATEGLNELNMNGADSTVSLHDRPLNRNNSFSANTYFHKEFKNKNILDIKADYWRDSRDQDRSLSAISNTNVLVDELNDHSADRLANYAAKADYIIPGKNSSRFSFGAKSSLTNFDYHLNYGLLLTDLPVFTGGTFHYQEKINAGYLSEVFPKAGSWSFEAGLRLENTQSDPGQGENRNYTDLFPNLVIQKEFASGPLNNINFSYSRRTFRPRYDYLNPLDLYLSPFSYTTGNPLLRPEYLDQAILTFTFLKKYFLVLNYSRNTQSMNSELNQASELVSYTTYDNLSSSNDYSAAFNLPVDAGRFHLNTSIIYNYKDLTGTFNSEVIHEYKSNFAFNASGAYSFPKDFLLRLNAFYTGPTVNGQVAYGSRSDITLNFSKTWNKNLTVTLKAEDPFYINNERFSVRTPYQYAYSENKWNSRIFGISLNYLFKSGNGFSTRRVEKSNSEEVGRRN